MSGRSWFLSRTGLGTELSTLLERPPPRPLATDAAEALATEDVFIHVSPEGDDDNPGTEERPLRTFGGAIERLRPLWRRRQRVVLAPGSYTIDDPVFNVHLGHQVGAGSQPLIIQGGFADQSGQRVVETFNSTSVTDPTLSLAPNSLTGARLRFVDGQAAGHAYLVAENTEDSITVSSPFVRAPAPGDHFVIERPNVTIEYEGLVGFDSIGTTALVMSGITWRPTRPGNSAAFLLSGNAEVFAFGCEWDMRGGIFQVVNGCTLLSGFGSLRQIAPDITAAATAGSDGCYIHDGNPTFGFRTGIGSVFGHWCTRKIGLTAQGGGIWSCNSLSAVESPISVDGNYGAVTFEVFAPGSIANTTGPGVQAGGPGASLLLNQTEIDRVRGDAIVLNERAYARLVGVRGQDNAGHGVRISGGSRAMVDAETTVTGRLGDVHIAGSAHLWTEATQGISDDRDFTRVDRGEG